MKALLLFLILLSGVAHASGLHLMAGGGLNFTTYKPQEKPVVAGAGLNFKTDLGYYFSNQWAVEWSAQVKFNRQNELFIWDTLMTLGVRYQFESTYYMRAFYGRSPTVVYLNNAPEVNRETDASRLQFNGPVYGLGIGKQYKMDSGKIWFIESAISYQYLSEETGIRNDGDVPVETFNRDAENPIHIYSIYAIIGVKVF